MSLQNSPTHDSALAAADALAASLTGVSERCFFAMAEGCDRVAFDELAVAVTGWQVAAVTFSGQVRGVMRCALPAGLGGLLFDAFAGRSGDEPEPEPSMMADLLGEFSNMVCGAWLTSLAMQQPFELGRPEVAQMPESWRPMWPSAGCLEVAAAIEGLPVLIHVEPSRPAGGVR
jgi:hypothetical protein